MPFGFYAPYLAAPVNYDGTGGISAVNWNDANAFWQNGYTVPINPSPDFLGAVATSAMVDQTPTGGAWLSAQKAALDIANAIDFIC